MQLRFHNKFNKQYRQLPSKIQKKAKTTIVTFKANPHHKSLRNHALNGSLKGKRAVLVTGNVRIIFIKQENYKKVTLLGIGTRNQLYK